MFYFLLSKDQTDNYDTFHVYCFASRSIHIYINNNSYFQLVTFIISFITHQKIILCGRGLDYVVPNLTSCWRLKHFCHKAELSPFSPFSSNCFLQIHPNLCTFTFIFTFTCFTIFLKLLSSHPSQLVHFHFHFHLFHQSPNCFLQIHPNLCTRPPLYYVWNASRKLKTSSSSEKVVYLKLLHFWRVEGVFL